MDLLQSRNVVSASPENGMDNTHSDVSEMTKSVENYLSTLHPNIGFVKSNTSGIVLPQFPCLMINYENRPGPLVTPNLVPMRPVAHSFDVRNETPKVAKSLESDGRLPVGDRDATMCK